jgi:hypothetical protein
MGAGQRFEVPEGWIVRGFHFEVEPTTPEQPGQIAESFGGRRFAYNWALAQVKANLDARKAEPAIAPLAWNFYALRRAWNQAKHQVAPWWRCSSKEVYASGIADLVVALGNWSDAKAGRRAGRRVGFPRFKARRHDRGRVRFTTGAMRLAPDRRHIFVPVIGRLQSKENTRRLERLLAKGRARILSITLTEHGGRLYVSVATIVAQAPRMPTSPGPVVGSTLASTRSGQSSPMKTTRSSASLIPPPGQQRNSCAAGWLGNYRAGPSAPGGTARRTPSWRPWTGGRSTCAASPSTPLPPAWPAAKAPSSSKTSTSPRWAGERSGAACTRPGWAGSVPCWPIGAPGEAGSWWRPTVVRVLQIPLVRWGSPKPTSPSWSSATWSAASRSKCSV